MKSGETNSSNIDREWLCGRAGNEYSSENTEQDRVTELVQRLAEAKLENARLIQESVRNHEEIIALAGGIAAVDEESQKVCNLLTGPSLKNAQIDPKELSVPQHGELIGGDDGRFSSSDLVALPNTSNNDRSELTGAYANHCSAPKIAPQSKEETRLEQFLSTMHHTEDKIVGASHQTLDEINERITITQSDQDLSLSRQPKTDSYFITKLVLTALSVIGILCISVTMIIVATNVF